jgi:flagellar biosynthesis regulator FlaF
MTSQLDRRTAMLFIARTRKKMSAEREVAIEELRAWFRAQIDDLREEMAADREELRAARAELERWQLIGKDIDDAVRLH